MKVYWTPYSFCTNEMFLSIQIEFMKPVPVIFEISKDRETSDYLKCPAFLDSCKNTFVIKSPWTFKVKVDREKKYVTTTLPQHIYDGFFINRENQSSQKDPFLITLPPQYVFYSDKDVEMEVIPCFLTSSIENLRVIPGKYNISKWIRPVDFTCEVIDNNKEIIINENDPLFYVRFYSKNDEKITLERVEQTSRLWNTIQTCTKFKKQIPGKIKHFKYLYSRAESFINLFKQKEIKEKKCPFDFLHRRK
jgi:hypothetical protein